MTEIYGITGMPLSGKTLVAKFLKEEGFAMLDMGDVVRKEMKKRDIESGNEGDFVNSQRDTNGMNAIAKLSIPYLEELIDDHEKVVITGMRGWSEKKKFEAETGEDIEIISVWSSRKTRRKRREARMRDEDVKGQGFHKRDLREIENGVGKLMALSDYMIRNEDISKKKLKREVVAIAR